MTDESLEIALAVAAACSVILKNLPQVAELDPEEMAQSVDAILFGTQGESLRPRAKEHVKEIVREAQNLKERREQAKHSSGAQKGRKKSSTRQPPSVPEA